MTSDKHIKHLETIVSLQAQLIDCLKEQLKAERERPKETLSIRPFEDISKDVLLPYITKPHHPLPNPIWQVFPDNVTFTTRPDEINTYSSKTPIDLDNGTNNKQ